mmetsp:Transcript_63817/g.120893  ORF Transcript_63817/g.120893 Transcript_63817/m.120893 type:complete len:128 (-) Transcript_63817:422-805(-)
MPSSNGSDRPGARQPRLDNPAEITAAPPQDKEDADIRPAAPAAYEMPPSKLVDNGGLKPMKSCLSGSKSPKSDNTVRTDSRGVIIEPGKKKHRAAFVDEIKPGQKIAEVKEVAQFKTSQPGCGCVIT